LYPAAAAVVILDRVVHRAADQPLLRVKHTVFPALAITVVILTAIVAAAVLVLLVAVVRAAAQVQVVLV
jgi:hypothetical protein